MTGCIVTSDSEPEKDRNGPDVPHGCESATTAWGAREGEVGRTFQLRIWTTTQTVCEVSVVRLEAPPVITGHGGPGSALAMDWEDNSKLS